MAAAAAKADSVREEYEDACNRVETMKVSEVLKTHLSINIVRKACRKHF
jgi:hypothetical protein